MASTYTPLSLSGGIPSGTALTAEFAKLKDALDACVQRAVLSGNDMEVDLDMNSHKLLNVIKGVDLTDVATMENLADALGNVETLQQLTNDLAALDSSVNAEIDALQLSVDTITTALAILAKRSQEDRAVAIVANGTAGGAFPGRVNTQSSGDDLELSKADLHDWVNIYWAATDNSDSSIWSNGAQSRLNFTLVNTDTGAAISGESYTLQDSNGDLLEAGYMEPGDTLRGNIWGLPSNGSAGVIRIHKASSASGVSQVVFNTAIAAEVASRQAGDNALAAQVAATNTTLASETTSRQTVDASLSNQITALDNAIDARLLSVEAQLPDDDTALANDIAANAAALAQEITDTNGDIAGLLVTTAGNTSASNANASGLAAEITSRQTVDASLAAQVTAEASARSSADSALSDVIATLQTDVGDLQVRTMPMSFTNDAIPDATQVMKFQVAEAFDLLNNSLKAICNTAPSGGTAIWSLRKNGVEFGTVTWADGSLNGTYSAWPTESFAENDIFAIVTGVQNSMTGVALTFRKQEA